MFTNDRHETVFSIRFAVRILERKVCLWRRIAGVFKFFSILSGSAALMGMIAGYPTLVGLIGFIFAVLQAAEYSIDPAGAAAEAKAMRTEYAKLFADKADINDEQLATAYSRIVSTDPVISSDALRDVAFNDVCLEMGIEEQYLLPLDRERRFIKRLSS